MVLHAPVSSKAPCLRFLTVPQNKHCGLKIRDVDVITGGVIERKNRDIRSFGRVVIRSICNGGHCSKVFIAIYTIPSIT